jgi:hypothetical protein
MAYLHLLSPRESKTAALDALEALIITYPERGGNAI